MPEAKTFIEVRARKGSGEGTKGPAGTLGEKHLRGDFARHLQVHLRDTPGGTYIWKSGAGFALKTLLYDLLA